VTLVDFAECTRVLKFESVIRLEHTPENAPDFRIEDYARSHLSLSETKSGRIGDAIRPGLAPAEYGRPSRWGG
jgi:hypothetical protein